MLYAVFPSLSSLEGYAINTIHIEGVEHEFATIPGVKEDVTNIILNLKQVRFKQVVESSKNEKVSITKLRIQLNLRQVILVSI